MHKGEIYNNLKGKLWSHNFNIVMCFAWAWSLALRRSSPPEDGRRVCDADCLVPYPPGRLPCLQWRGIPLKWWARQQTHPAARRCCRDTSWVRGGTRSDSAEISPSPILDSSTHCGPCWQLVDANKFALSTIKRRPWPSILGQTFAELPCAHNYYSNTEKEAVGTTQMTSLLKDVTAKGQWASSYLTHPIFKLFYSPVI